MPHKMTEIVKRKDLINYLYGSRKYKHILSEVALTKSEYTIDEIAELLGVEERRQIRRTIKRGLLIGSVPEIDILKLRRKEAAEVAKELGYGEETVERILDASTENEIDRILTTARNCEARYPIGASSK